MISRRKELQVGICVILSALVLVFGMLWLKQFRFAGGMVRYQVDFTNVDGLQASDRVQVRGIRMGKVQGFAMVEDFVRVTMLIDRSVVLHDDAQFRLATVGIVGEKVVEVTPGRGAPAAPGHSFKGLAETSLTSMTATASQTMERLDGLLGDLRDLVGALKQDNRLSRTVDAAGSTLRTVDGTLGENRQDLRAMIKDLRGASAALRQALAAPGHGAEGTLAQAKRTLTRADSTLGVVVRTANSLDTLVARLEAGQGSAGKLLNDDRLYEEATHAITDVRELIKDIRRDPTRYFKLKLF
jgi:phospholipid/cholesterol/gamma-HCH transport system substrate-binding protein